MNSTICDVCIESGHFYVNRNAQLDTEAFLPSLRFAQAVHQELEKLSIASRKVILFDDEVLTNLQAVECGKKIIGHLDAKIAPDYFCFESKLRQLLPELILSLQETKRRQIDKEIYKYQKINGAPACSHNVAIWHLLRLGLLKNDSCRPCWKLNEGVVSDYDCTIPPAKLVVSILDKVFEGSESKANNILRFCSTSVDKKIIRIYFSPADIAGHSKNKIDEVCKAVYEAMHSNPSIIV